MTVEFLEPDEYPPEQPDQQAVPADPATDRRARLTGLADLGLSAAGAALLVVACFQTTYSIHNLATIGSTDYRVDGWGRIGASDLFAGQHSARVGIVLCVCAALAVLGTAARVIAHRGGTTRSRLDDRLGDRVGDALGFVAAGGAAASIGGVVLDLLATQDSYRAALHASPLSQSDRPTRLPSFVVGGFVWVAGAGAVCIVMAIALSAVVRSRKPQVPVVSVPVHIGDEDELR